MPAMPPPTTSTLRVTGTPMGVSASLRRTRCTVERVILIAFSVALALSLWTQAHCSRMLAISQLERVHPANGRRIAERLLVQVRRAAGDDHAVEVMLLDGVDDRLLPRIGAHIDVVLGEDHALVLAQLFGHMLHIDGGRDVVPAMADENPCSACHWTAPFILARARKSVLIAFVERTQIGLEEAVGHQARQRLLHRLGRCRPGDGREKAQHDQIGEQAVAQLLRRNASRAGGTA